MEDEVIIQVGGKNYAFSAKHLPPVGARIHVQKHLFDWGTGPTVEVVEHEWRLEEPREENGSPFFSITIKTLIVK